MRLLDDVIRVEYERFAVPVDQIVSDPNLAAEFAQHVKANMPGDGGLDVAATNWRLMTLRKRGEDKGGLRRLERAHRGRRRKPR